MFSLFFISLIGWLSYDSAESVTDLIQDAADVTAVTFSGPTGIYTFSVTISSPDTGCDQYADWWEVLDEDGGLVYRRILAHSHVNEQPFTRQGGAVKIDESENVWIRAHMNNSGYGGVTYYGNTLGGFEPKAMPDGLGADVEKESPQPKGCGF